MARRERGEGGEKESLYLVDEVGDGTTMRSLRSDGGWILLGIPCVSYDGTSPSKICFSNRKKGYASVPLNTSSSHFNFVRTLKRKNALTCDESLLRRSFTSFLFVISGPSVT